MEQIEIRELEYILTLAEERSFSRAAERCYISQPQLSKLVRRAEARLGVGLFDRSTHPLTLTAEGETLLPQIRKLHGEYQELLRSSAALRRDRRADLTLAAPSFFCTYSLPPLIQSFDRVAPGFRVRLIESNDQDLKALLTSGTADLGITVHRELAEAFSSELLHEERIVLAVPSSLPVNRGLESFALSRKQLGQSLSDEGEVPSVPLSAFQDTDFLFLKSGNDLRERGIRLCRKAGFAPRITMELDQLLTAYYLACGGLGATFIRASIPFYAGSDERLCFYKIDDALTKRGVYLLYGNRGQSARGRDFVRHLKENAQPAG